MKSIFFLLTFSTFVITSCAIIRPNQVALKSKLGRINKKVKDPGPVYYNPFITKIIKVNISTMNLSIRENLPSKEGLTILSESSILYHIKSSEVPKIIEETGLDYENNLIYLSFVLQPQMYVRDIMLKICTAPREMKSRKKSRNAWPKFVVKRDLLLKLFYLKVLLFRRV